MTFKVMRFLKRPSKSARSNIAYQTALRVAIFILLILTITGAALADEDKAGEEKNITIVILGDRTSRAQVGVYGAVVKKARGERPNLYITVGDQIEGCRGNESKIHDQWDEYFKIVRRIRRNLFILPGNHDVRNEASEAIWVDRIKRDTNYSFDYGGVHFVLFDTGRWIKVDSLPEEKIDWLDADLNAHKDSRLTFVFFHIPYWYYTLPAGKIDRLHKIFKANGVDAVFSGHLHRYGSAVYDGIIYTIVGSSGGVMEDNVSIKGHFYNYVKLEVRGADFTMKIVPLEGEGELPADFVMIKDLKFFDEIEERYVVPEEFLSDTDAPKEGRELSIRIENIREVKLPFEIKWEPAGTNWEITPKGTTVEIPAGETGEATFLARFTDHVYPLPTFEVAYPYREGRTYDFEGALKLTRTIKIPRIGGVNVDGRVDGDEWDEATAAITFTDSQGMPSDIRDTSFFFGRDAENLYVLASCSTGTEDLVINAKNRDGAVWKDDSIDLFISPDPKSGVIYQISINTLGVILDRKIVKEMGKRRKTDPSWDAGCEAGIYISRGNPNGFFQLELKVPLSAFGADLPAAGDEWGINFGRLSVKSGERAQWQRHESFERFLGRMVFTR